MRVAHRTRRSDSDPSSIENTATPQTLDVSGFSRTQPGKHACEQRACELVDCETPPLFRPDGWQRPQFKDKIIGTGDAFTALNLYGPPRDWGNIVTMIGRLKPGVSLAQAQQMPKPPRPACAGTTNSQNPAAPTPSMGSRMGLSPCLSRITSVASCAVRSSSFGRR